MTRVRDLDDYVTRRLRMAGGAMMHPDAIEESLDELKQVYLLPMDVVEAKCRAEVGRFINFANYDYLGLGDDLRVRQAGSTASIEQGVGSGASRLVGGSRMVHDELERDLADFLGVDESITLVSGYLTNSSLIGHLLAKGDQVFVDDLSHNSVVVGAETSRATVYRFAHNDFDDLEAQLIERRSQGKRALIVVEGLYSMDGDVPDLPRLLELRDRYDAWVLIDEAHSIGVLGKTGRGVCEHFGINAREIDFIVGTLSKTFGCSGGFIAGRKRVIDWLRFTLPAFVFSVGVAPPVAAAVREGLAILQAEPWRINKLQDNAQFFFDEARARGFDVGSAVGAAVMTIQFSSLDQCMSAASALMREGFYAPPIPQLAVPKNRPRIRFFISSMHNHDQIRDALDVVAAVVREPLPLQNLDEFVQKAASAA